MNLGEYVFLRLHKGYKLRSKGENKINKKLGIQRIGPFRIKRRMERNAYELETGDEVGQFPPDWRIHPVVSVQQLEPAPDPMKPDEFWRARPQNPDPIETSGEHEIERIHKRRINKRGQPEYEVVWKGFGPEHNRWYRLDMLQNAKELVDEFKKDLRGTEASAKPLVRSPTKPSPVAKG